MVVWCGVDGAGGGVGAGKGRGVDGGVDAQCWSFRYQ